MQFFAAPISQARDALVKSGSVIIDKQKGSEPASKQKKTNFCEGASKKTGDGDNEFPIRCS